MKMRWKTKLYLILAVMGLLMAVLGKIILGDDLSKLQEGLIMGVGFGMFGWGFSLWIFSRWEEKNPKMMKNNEIEAKDERNIFIRRSAQAFSGEVLHWMLMGGAWAAIIMNAPLWIILSFVGAFLLKTVLDFMFMAYFNRKM